MGLRIKISVVLAMMVGLVILVMCGCSAVKPEIGGGAQANLLGYHMGGNATVDASDGLSVGSGALVPNPIQSPLPKAQQPRVISSRPVAQVPEQPRVYGSVVIPEPATPFQK